MIDPKTIDLTDLLATWYGAPVRSATPLPDSCIWLPESLKDWHALARRWDTRINHMTSMISPEQIRTTGGKAIFMVDATGDWRWCIDPNEPDSVFDAELYEPWERSTEQLPEFLVHNTVKEFIYGASAKMWTLNAPGEAVKEILSPLEEVAFGAWNWPAPGCRIFMGGDTLAQISPTHHKDFWEVDVATPNFADLSPFEKISGVDWQKREA
ncbi:hypothetical protein Q7689_01180 [Nocardiopsis tropica]|nr:hypothetical protein [Nocardiopsis tropica]